MGFYKILQIFLLKKFKIGLLDYRLNTLGNNPELIEILLKIQKEHKTLQSLAELYNIYKLSEQTKHLDGDIAEVGVYKGGSAKLIAINKGKRNLHLFDSFEGILTVSKSLDILRREQFKDTSLKEVKKCLSGFDNIFFHKGWFPVTAKSVKDQKFSFIHLDVDLYQSTLDALDFFYDRMNRGGVILSHDYNSIICPGVKKAFDKFFNHKEEIIIELAGTTQCLVVKL